MLELLNVYALNGKNREKMVSASGKYVFGDTTAEIKNGDIFITSDSYAPEKIEFVFSSPALSDDALVLGDHWERGYGDLEWKPVDESRVMPWYMLAYSEGKVYCYGVKTGGDSLVYFTASKNTVTLCTDIRCAGASVKLSGKTILAASIVEHISEKTPFEAACDFCSMLCEKPRFPKNHIYGGNDWYCNYGNNSFENIKLGAQRIAECAKGIPESPYMVIDDGWQFSWRKNYNGGPWKYCNSKFSDMSKMAREIENLGAVPGIWYRPLFTAEYIAPEGILSVQREACGNILDPSTDTALSYIANETKALCNFGYKLLKFDFASYDIFGRYGMDMGSELTESGWRLKDQSVTTAQAIKKFYKTIRQAAGEDTLLIGCNVIGHLGAGIIDIQRTGDDTSGREWDRTRKMGVNTLAFRMPQHKNFFSADADCVGMTSLVPWEKTASWMDLLAQSGTPLFISVAEDFYGEKQKEAIKAAFKTSYEASKEISVFEPCDWMEKLTPEKWRKGEKQFDYDWN